MLGQYLTDWFSLLRVGDTRPIVLGSWTEAPPRPNSGTGFLFGLRGCRRTTSITSSTPSARICAGPLLDDADLDRLSRHLDRAHRLGGHRIVEHEQARTMPRRLLDNA